MKCLLDLDGVICAWHLGVAKAFGLSHAELEQRWPEGLWNVWEAVGAPPTTGVTEDAFWAVLDDIPDFWETLPKMPDAGEILFAVEYAFGPQNVILASSPPRNPAAVAGKVAWIRKHMKPYRRRFAITPCKELLAHPGAVLVDDSETNVREFIHHGGQAVLVPRRWNRDHHLAGTAAETVSQKTMAILRSTK